MKISGFLNHVLVEAGSGFSTELLSLFVLMNFHVV